MSEIIIPDRHGENHTYYSSGPYLKKLTAGDIEQYEQYMAKFVSPRALKFALYALPVGYVALTGVQSATSDIQMGVTMVAPLKAAFSFLIASRVHSITKAQGDKVGRNQAGLEYTGINMFLATDEELAKFIDNDDPEVLKDLKAMTKEDNRSSGAGYPFWETTSSPTNTKASGPSFDMDGGGYDGGGDGGD